MKAKVLIVYGFIASLIVFLISDLLLVIDPSFKQFNISYFLKGTSYFFYVLLSIRLLPVKRFLFLLAFIVLFISSQSYLFYFGKINSEEIISNLRFFGWYFFGIILMLIYKEVRFYYVNEALRQLINKVGIIVISVVCLSIILGFVFDFKLFLSYGEGGRWGYKGVLRKSVTASYFFIIIINYLYYTHVILKNKYYLFLIVVFSSLFCGTKTIYFFNILLLLFHIMIKQKYMLKSFWYVFTTFLFFTIILFNKIIEKTEFLWGVFYELYSEKGFLYSFTSFRSEMLTNGINIYKLEWSWINYLIGGRLPKIKYFEMTFFDLFYFFGFFGFLLFLFILFDSIIKPFCKQIKVYGVFMLSSTFLAAFFTGQFFVNSTVILLFFYFLFLTETNGKIKGGN